MASINSIAFANLRLKAKINIRNCWITKTKTFKIKYFIGLALTISCLIICLWAAIQVGIIQTKFLTRLYALTPEQLIAEHPVFDEANNSIWLIKGFGPYAWYLTAQDPLGGAAYWCVGIFAIIESPLIVYYVSSFLIVVFPKKSKAEKQLKTEVENESK